MWPGPYGEWGSRKSMVASVDQSLKRLGVDYVDIFYSHRPDPDTPLEETMAALDYIVRSGRALYAGISSYKPEQTIVAAGVRRQLENTCLSYKPSFNMFNRWIEDGLLETLKDEKIGCIVFSPLAQGLLSGKYLNGIPEESRAAKPHGFLKEQHVTEDKINKIKKLGALAEERGQSIAQLAIAWVLRDKTVTSALFGASNTEQIKEIVAVQNNLMFSESELCAIEKILA